MASDVSGLGQDGASSAARPIGLLVAGMHRSGTSALTRTASLLGAALPSELLGARRSNPTGHWESSRVLRLHDEILASIGGHWSDWTQTPPDWFATPQAERFAQRLAELLTAEFADTPLFVLKDPRICRLAPLWLRAMNLAQMDVRVLMPLRQPQDVAASLETRDGFPRSKGSLIWLRHVLDAEHHTRGVPRFLLTYDALLKDWRDVMARAADQLAFRWPDWTPSAEEKIDAYLNARHRHHQDSDGTSGLDEADRWTAKAYAALMDLKDDPEARRPRRRLHDIGEALAELTTAVGPLLRDEVAFRERKAAKALEEAERRSREALEAAEARAAEALEELRRSQTSELGGHNHNERISELQAELEAMAAEQAASAATLEAAVVEGRRARRSAELRRREIETLQEQLSTQQQAGDQLQAQLADKRAALDVAGAEATRWRRAANRLADEVGDQVAAALDAARRRELQAAAALAAERLRADDLDQARLRAERARAAAAQDHAEATRDAEALRDRLEAATTAADDLQTRLAAREAALREIEQRGFWRRLLGSKHGRSQGR